MDRTLSVARFTVLAASLVLLIAAPAVAQVWICGDDGLLADVEGDTVVVDHLRATYNCCPELLGHVVTVGAGMIEIEEYEILADEICLCYCCFDLHLEIPDVAPGPWTVRLEYWEPDVGDWATLETTLEVPDVGQAGLAPTWVTTDSGCLPPGTDVPEPGAPESWSRVKARWR